MLWKHPNDCVFNGATPNVQQILRFILEQGGLWYLAGIGGLAQLGTAIKAARCLGDGHVFLGTWCKCDLLRVGCVGICTSCIFLLLNAINQSMSEQRP